MMRSSSLGRDMARRSALGLFGAAPLVAAGGFATASSVAASARIGPPGEVPPGLLPGGAVDQLIGQQAAQDLFSGSVMLAYHWRPVLVRSYGQANKQLSAPNRPDTIFALASVTKAFTAVAVTQLAQRAQLGFNDTLGTYLPTYLPTYRASPLTWPPP